MTFLYILPKYFILLFIKYILIVCYKDLKGKICLEKWLEN